MKTSFYCLSASLLLTSISPLSAGTNYSGIYEGSASNIKFIAAITKGRRVLGVDETTEGLSDAIDPSVSKINKKGKLKGKTPAGTSVVAKIKKDFKLTGTLKSAGRTVPLTGERTFK